MNKNILRTKDNTSPDKGTGRPIPVSQGTPGPWEQFWRDLWMALTHIHVERMFLTFTSISFRPGTTLNDYVNSRQAIYVQPFQYFVLSLSVYSFVIKYILKPQHWYIGVVDQLTVPQSALLLMGLALIGWMIVGVRGISLIQVFSVFLYVYGTAFLLNPVINVAESELVPALHGLQPLPRVLAGDVPTVLFIFYALWSFFMVRRIPVRRFYMTAVLGYAYYATILYFSLR